MNKYRADLHIHTVLSPCGDLEMSPKNIVKQAAGKKLDIIGITDHNSTKHCLLIEELAKEYGMLVLKGAEVTTKEEAHCLAFFEKTEELMEFQEFLEQKLPPIKNKPEKFGYQVVVDAEENILEQVEFLLISAIDASVNELERFVHKLNGIFIPAHVDRPKFSLTSQLGFIPADLKADALELSRHTSKEAFVKSFSYLKDRTFTRASDAHMPEDIGTSCSIFHMEELCFQEVKKALAGADGRKVEIDF